VTIRRPIDATIASEEIEMSLTKQLGGFGACLALAAALMVPPAGAQGRDDCDGYAREAVEQAHRNERQNCGFDGPRWSDNRQGHFAWCLISPRQAREENEARREQLQQCERRSDRPERREERREDRGDRRDDRRDDRRSERVGKRANCDTYSKIAEAQTNANQKYDCGYRGGEWSTDSRAHFGWCMANKRDFMLDEMRYRAIELQKCFNKLGDFDEDGGDSAYRRRRF
jgi:hypothetical protein